MQSSTYTIGLLGYKIIAWIGIVFFLFCAVMSWFSGQGNISPFFLIFVAISITMLLIASKIEISSEAITVFSLYAAYKINWDEINRIELGHQGTFVFSGHNKRLVVPAGTWWTGKKKKEAYDYMLNEIEIREFTIKDSFASDYKIHKNTKVKTTT